MESLNSNGAHVLHERPLCHDGHPGTVYRILLGRCRSSQCIASMHAFDIFRVMGLLVRGYPPEVLVFGVEPKHLEWSTELSSEVSEALPFQLKVVKRELAAA